MCEETIAPAGFAALGLSGPILHALRQVGYETPSPIQAECIPRLLAGVDLLGQAQTGTGKTAAFALPILSRLELTPPRLQALVLTPTRELGIQVGDAPSQDFRLRLERLPGQLVLSTQPAVAAELSIDGLSVGRTPTPLPMPQHKASPVASSRR